MSTGHGTLSADEFTQLYIAFITYEWNETESMIRVNLGAHLGK